MGFQNPEFEGRLRRMKVLESLRLWIDPVERAGPEAMAADEWLLGAADEPVLRVYRWQGAWGSVGYFGCLADAETSFPGLSWVRRWTGGGTVDHRRDWTYSLVVPKGFGLAETKGAESYRLIHAALAEVLDGEGVGARLSMGDGETGASACFANPVSHDIVGDGNEKLAGAGQRRSVRGLLHQGSVAGVCVGGESLVRAERLAAALAMSTEIRDFDPPWEVVERMVRERYGKAEWTKRR